MHDLKFAVRALTKSPGFTAVAVLTIAVAIGANTALFSIFDRLVLNPLDLPEANRLVRIWTNNTERNVVGPVMSVPKYELFVEQQTSFSGIATYGFGGHTLVRENADPEQLPSLSVTQSWVPTLGLQLALGRNFTKEEDTPGGPPVTILGHDVWRNKFGARENIIGETVMLNGIGHTVVGVLPPQLPAPISFIQLVVPRPLEPPGLTPEQVRGGAGFLQVTARLKPGVSYEQADAEVRTISQRYKDAFPTRLDAGNNNELRTWTEEIVGPVRPTFYMLLTAVAFVLLIACANVSNLFLSRLTARHKEIAVRLSMGATRQQLIRQFLTETAVFCTVATLLGVLLAIWSLDGLERLLVNQFQFSTNTQFTLNAATLGFTIGLSALACSIIGLVPAWQASRVNLSEVLKDNSRGTPGGAKGGKFRAFLVVAEVALSVLLLIGSSLLLVSFIKLQRTPPGFNPQGIGGAFLNIPAQRYAAGSPQVLFLDQIIEKLRAHPQVKSVAAGTSLPVGGFGARTIYAIKGQPVPTADKRPVASLFIVTEDYFSMFSIPLKEGRLLTPQDRADTPGVCIINESFAKKLFPGKSALGESLLRGPRADIPHEIVGIVGDVKSGGLNTPPPDTVYFPFRQLPRGFLTLAARTDGDPAVLQNILRSAVASVDNTLATSNFQTMDAAIRNSLGLQRITAWLTGVFAGVALVLSAVGLYSVLAYAVTQRTSEIGIRMALGADKGQVVNLILSQGMKLVAIGLVIGLAASAAGTRLLSSLLYQIEPLNPLVFGGVTVLFALVAVLACLLPSLRASRIDPLVALRSE
jgi:predicted permease